MFYTVIYQQHVDLGMLSEVMRAFALFWIDARLHILCPFSRDSFKQCSLMLVDMNVCINFAFLPR